MPPMTKFNFRPNFWLQIIIQHDAIDNIVYTHLLHQLHAVSRIKDDFGETTPLIKEEIEKACHYEDETIVINIKLIQLIAKTLKIEEDQIKLLKLQQE